MPAHRKDFSLAVSMYESGKSLAEIAKVTGCHRNTIHAALRRRGVSMRPNLRFGSENHFYRDGVEYDQRVRTIVMKAIWRGRLIPEPCEVCRISGALANGKSAVEAHHDDYNFPLRVRWLCGEHHREWHSRNVPVRRTVELPPMQHQEVASLGGGTTWKRNREAALAQLQRARDARWGRA